MLHSKLTPILALPSIVYTTRLKVAIWPHHQTVFDVEDAPDEPDPPPGFCRRQLLELSTMSRAWIRVEHPLTDRIWHAQAGFPVEIDGLPLGVLTLCATVPMRLPAILIVRRGYRLLSEIERSSSG